MKKLFNRLSFLGMLFLWQGAAWASEADLKIPDLHEGNFAMFGGLSGFEILLYGAMVILGTVGLSLYQFFNVKALPAHKSMLDVAETIFQTCKTYLKQQVKFLAILFAIIASAMSYYFVGLKHEPLTTLGLVLLFSIVGMAGSTLVAYYGIRVNTYANARTAFASLRGKPWDVRRPFSDLCRACDDGDHPALRAARYRRLLFPRIRHR
jgi:K(+)-stimulated pyrophosphate-energized sodium pump